MKHSAKTRHLYRDLEGLRVHYREAGFPASSHSFRDVLPVLGEHSYVIAPDLPGFGFSDAPPLDEYVTDFGTPVGYLMAMRQVGGHLFLETHAAEVAALLTTFVGDVLDRAGVPA